MVNQETEPTDSSANASVLDRVKAVPARTKTLIVLGLVLLLFAVTGRLQARTDVELEAVEAVEIARDFLDFEPVDEDARLVRQGFSLIPVWAVSFSIPGDGVRDFERIMTVEINANNGEVIRISTDQPES